MTDLGPLNYFLGISVTRNSTSMFLSQRKYASEILERACMLNYKPCWTPVETDSKLENDGLTVSDPTLCRSLVVALQYVRSCMILEKPILRRILCYIRGTLDYGLQLFASSTTLLVAYSDADWAGCPSTRRSTSGYCDFIGNNLLSWSSK
ncbi:uncharacterized mitochondrial protein AtMg00810-like [Rutidosis leptorrhynchoides]|uniref:uncharacterized mitochondrial protein AtMg00810-like n=1 Tax=Rutidosis leptorrhynchoides TaxID=125765 RepID=UPI003A998871